MNTYFQKIFVGIFVLLLIGCNPLSGRVGEEPPLPTIVPAEPTEAAVVEQPVDDPTVTPTALPLPTSTSTPQPSQGDVIETQPQIEATATTEDVDAQPATPTVEPTPVPTEPTPTAQMIPLSNINLGLIPVATGFERPTFLTHANDNSNRLFVTEQVGRIQIINNGAVNSTPFLDITNIVGSDANEQGLLSVAFHSNYSQNGFFFVNYTDKQGDTVIARYSVSTNPDIADPNSGQVLLTISQPYANHNGGQIAFGPDGYLYIGMGDGGAANDPQNRAQDLTSLLGKILRIDVDNAAPYGAPDTNPFVDNGEARPEIWSFGWRNPWRFSFDMQTGDMYVGDVGQNKYEEIHVEPAGVGGGRNYGWRLMEGFHCFNPEECEPSSLGVELPIAEYEHSEGCSVSGGYVYRGAQYPELVGTYLYGDYCTGTIWGTRPQPGGTWEQAKLLQTDHSISSFGQDQLGQLYVLDHQGGVYKLGTN